jgi:hypothetical protein
MSDLVQRLREAHPHSPQYANGSMIFAEAADEIERLTAEIAIDEQRVADLMTDLDRVAKERDAFKQTLYGELDGNLRLRAIGGARDDEPMSTFLERVFAERDALRADAARYRWLRQNLNRTISHWFCTEGDEVLDAAIDAQIAAEASNG